MSHCRSSVSRLALLLLVMLAIPVMSQPADELTGRLLRGTGPADFDTLTRDPDRRLVMLMDSDGLKSLQGLTGYQQLLRIGYTPREIAQTVRAGNTYKLAVWPRRGLERQATWDNVVDLVQTAYPEVAAKVGAQRKALQSHDFTAIEREAGWRFADVDAAGPSDTRYMTLSRLQAGTGSLVEVRAFLYHVVHLRELFTGDGYTRQADGSPGVAEYIMPNMRIADIPGAHLIDIPITLP